MNIYQYLNRKQELKDKRSKIEKTFASMTDDQCAAILAYGQEYNYYCNRMRRDFPNGMYLYNSLEWNSKEVQDYHYCEKAEASLKAVCECFEIDYGVVYRAAQILEKFYEKTEGMVIPPYKAFLKSMIIENIYIKEV